MPAVVQAVHDMCCRLSRQRERPAGANPAIFLIILVCALLAAGAGSAQDLPPGKTFRDCPDCPEMVVIPAGSFLMGSSQADSERDFAAVPQPPADATGGSAVTDASLARQFMPREHPQHSVTIARRFALGKFPVTTAEFAAFVRETNRKTSNCFIHFSKGLDGSGVAWQHPGFDPSDRDPVVCVNWFDARAYVDWLNKKPGGDYAAGRYRLPDEAEWEYAARAGTQTSRWWGVSIGVANARCDGCEAPCGQQSSANAPPACAAETMRTSAVGSYPANPFGLYDMLGNVWQLTDDCWHESYDGAPADGSAWFTGDCNRRPLRGGGWASSPWSLRSATRAGVKVNQADNASGFRVAKTLQ
jgi:formylglycine-generating enzyme required for sulfatase activity